MLPSTEVRRDTVGRVTRGHAHQHGVDGVAAGLRRLDGVEQSGDAWTIERRIAGAAGALVDDGVVVFEELRLLRVLERDEDHRVAAGRHHPPRQTDHDVVVPANTNAVANREAGAHVRHRFVVTACHTPTGNQVERFTGLTRHEADDHGAHVRRAAADLHREVGHVGGLRDARQPEQTAIDVVVHAGGLGIRAERVLLHDPDVGAAVVEQHLGVVDHAAVDACHGERDADEQPEPQPRQDELAPRVQDVPAGQADHGAAPRSAGTTVTRLPSSRSRSL